MLDNFLSTLYMIIKIHTIISCNNKINQIRTQQETECDIHFKQIKLFQINSHIMLLPTILDNICIHSFEYRIAP